MFIINFLLQPITAFYQIISDWVIHSWVVHKRKFGCTAPYYS